MTQNLEYTVKRSQRKTISIYIERDGTVTVRAPKDMEEEKLQKAIKTKEYLIYKHLAVWEQLNESKVEREFVNGQSYLYLGRNYRLKLVEKQDVPLKLKNGYFLLDKTQKKNAEKHFIEFYKKKGISRIKNIIETYKGKLGVLPNDIKIMELQNRWGSCSEKGNLNFHWKCLMAPIRTLEYIIVHEMTHLLHMNHSPEFWNELDKVFPDYHDEVIWLREHGAGMAL